MKVPIKSAVIRTPTEARVIPGPITGRISLKSVSIPPEKRMTVRAKTPINCAMSGLFSSIPKLPEPANIPIPRKSNNVGIPSLKLALHRNNPKITSIDPYKSRNSAVTGMLF